MRPSSACLSALAFLAGCCCDDDDDCHTEYVCYFDGYITYCQYVTYCHDDDYYYYYYGVGAAEEGAGAIDLSATVRDAGEGKIDVLVEVFGDRVDGETPVSVCLLGPGFATVRRQSPRILWAFYGVPAAEVQSIQADIVGTSLRVKKSLDLADHGEFSPCDPRERLLPARVFPDLTAGLAAGESISVRAPGAEEILASGTYLALSVEILPPGDSDPQVSVVLKGDSSAIRLDRPGTWRLRATILLDDACGPGSADALVIEEAEVPVF
jgi:hypothetical protein